MPQLSSNLGMNILFNKSRFLKTRSLFLTSLSAACLLLAGTQAQAQDRYPADPMQSKYSQEIRKAFAECRAENSPLSQYFCTCRVIEKQCEGPHRLEHGNWNTVEFWPSDNESEREVQFILFLDYEAMDDFAPLESGLVTTCVQGNSEVNLFIGNDVDTEVAPTIWMDHKIISSEMANDDGSLVISFPDENKMFEMLRTGRVLRAEYQDIEGVEKQAEFDLFGFDEVSRGWDKLCTTPDS